MQKALLKSNIGGEFITVKCCNFNIKLTFTA